MTKFHTKIKLHMIQIICTNCKVLISYKKIQIKEICTSFTTIFTLYTKKEKSNTEVKQKF